MYQFVLWLYKRVDAKGLSNSNSKFMWSFMKICWLKLKRKSFNKDRKFWCSMRSFINSRHVQRCSFYSMLEVFQFICGFQNVNKLFSRKIKLNNNKSWRNPWKQEHLVMHHLTFKIACKSSCCKKHGISNTIHDHSTLTSTLFLVNIYWLISLTWSMQKLIQSIWFSVKEKLFFSYFHWLLVVINQLVICN